MPNPGSILDRIIEVKQEEVRALKAATDPGSLEEQAREAPAPRDFLAALKNADGIPIIAEIKKASPSAGSLRENVRVGDWAARYQAAGAAALSVLTDKTFFKGALDDLVEAKAASTLPVLRKDFIIDPLQVYQSRAAGADAVLLIVAALPPSLLADLYHLALDLGMRPLIEVHREEELPAALSLKPTLIGINNRDLTTMEVSLSNALRLRPLIENGAMVAGESGVSGPEDAALLKAGGLDALLIGSLLMRSEDPGRILTELRRAG